MKHIVKKATAAVLASMIVAAGVIPAMASETDEAYITSKMTENAEMVSENDAIYSAENMTGAMPGYTGTGNDYINKLGNTSEAYVCAAEIVNGKIVEYAYDTKGRILSYSDGERTTKYSYNSKGFCIAKETVLNDGTRLTYEKYTCDSKGRRITSEVVADEMGWSDDWFDDAYKAKKMTYSYDGSGRISSIYGTDGNGNDFTKKFAYENGYLSSVSMTSSYVKGTAKYSYNTDHYKAQVTVNTQMGISSYTQELEYEFDKYGNTILRKDCNNRSVTRNVMMPLSQYLSYKNVKGFSDTQNGKYYETPVKWAVYRNITKGVSATAFAPNQACTRGQIVTFLWRAAGQPKVQGQNPFKDVKSGSYYYDAVLWAVKTGITNGTSATAFSPNATCNRAQTVTFLWRAAGGPKASNTTNLFTDINAKSYYYNAVLWAVENGVTNGVSDITFAPSALCTRGQIVTFMYRDMA